MAGGFTIKIDQIPNFRNQLIDSYEKKQKILTTESNLYLDTIIAPSALNENFYKEINILGPFGSGNTEPKFLLENIKVISSKIINNDHIVSVLSGNDGFIFKGFTWNGANGPLEPYLNKKNKRKINIVGKMRLNEWQGRKNIEFIIEDISLA